MNCSSIPDYTHTLDLLNRTGTKKEDIKYYVLHQANERIIEAAARRLKEPMEKFPMTISQFGNTSTASIPLLLDDMIQKDMLKRGDKIMFQFIPNPQDRIPAIQLILKTIKIITNTLCQRGNDLLVLFHSMHRYLYLNE